MQSRGGFLGALLGGVASIPLLGAAPQLRIWRVNFQPVECDVLYEVWNKSLVPFADAAIAGFRRHIRVPGCTFVVREPLERFQSIMSVGAYRLAGNRAFEQRTYIDLMRDKRDVERSATWGGKVIALAMNRSAE